MESRIKTRTGRRLSGDAKRQNGITFIQGIALRMGPIATPVLLFQFQLTQALEVLLQSFQDQRRSILTRPALHA